MVHLWVRRWSQSFSETTQLVEMVSFVFLGRKKYEGCFQFIFIVILGPYLIVSEQWKEHLCCPLRCLYGPVTVMSKLLWFPCETLAFLPILFILSSLAVDLLLHFNAQRYGKRYSASAEGQGNHLSLYCSLGSLFTGRILPGQLLLEKQDRMLTWNCHSCVICELANFDM